MRVLMVASEVVPYSKTGGLADVMGGLPVALARLGQDVTVVVPRHRGRVPEPTTTSSAAVQVGERRWDVGFLEVSVADRHRVVFVDSPPHFDRPGLYGEGGRDYDDNADRFALLAVAALDFAERDSGPPFSVVHAHDWQAGLVPAFLSLMPERWPRLSEAGRVLTIHNLAYQGLFARETVPTLGLPWSMFTMDTGEFWGQFSFLKTGIVFSDRVTTVSPTYARETLTTASGCGLEGVLAACGDRYTGILNGIDDVVWNPEADALLPATYSAGQLEGKRACKRALLRHFGLPIGDDALERPVVGTVSRLVDQKGIDLIKAASPTLMGFDATWIFVGTGDDRYERWLQHLAAVHPARVGALVGFDEKLAHLVEAGADLFLMPSRFEPCGLNQMYSLRYGTVPVVRGVGGLDDTIRPYTARARRANGFKFRDPSADELARTLRHALRVYRQPDVWRRLMQQGMAEDHSWRLRAREYVRVYRRARHDQPRRRIQG